jgi:hypothetical protein
MFHISMMPPPAPGHELFAAGTSSLQDDAGLKTALSVIDVGMLTC